MKPQLPLILGFLFALQFSTKAQKPVFDQIKILSVKNLEAERPNAQEVYMDDLIQFEIAKPDSIKLREP